MQKLSNAFIGLPIISLRTGAAIGKTIQPLINPNNLKIEAWYSSSIYTKHSVLVPIQEIREISRLGVAVNDHESLTEPDDLIRLQPVIKLQFNPIGKLVVTEGRKKIGKVEDYSVDIDSMYIVSLYVSQRSIRAFNSPQLTVNRLQIVEITDKRIVIKDIENTQRLQATAPSLA